MFQSHASSLALGLSIGIVALLLTLWIESLRRHDLKLFYEQRLYLLKSSLAGSLAKLGAELEGKVDPWAMQRELMQISGQERPTRPTLTKASLLYGALLMEESSETFKALGEVLLSARPVTDELDLPTDGVISNFMQAAPEMLEYSERIRREIAKLPDDWRLDLRNHPGLMLDLFDGTTDVTVVNCGFAEACGFPGAAGYRDVGGSNLSKANPATGFIDKDPSGKWIKGVNYRAPDLGTVLELDRQEPCV